MLFDHRSASCPLPRAIPGKLWNSQVKFDFLASLRSGVIDMAYEEDHALAHLPTINRLLTS